MIPNPRPEPEAKIPESVDVEPSELSDEEQIDAFCAELLAALTKLEGSPAAWSAQGRALCH